MIAHCAYLYISALGTIRVPESKSVSSHRASRHVGMDITVPLRTNSKSRGVQEDCRSNVYPCRSNIPPQRTMNIIQPCNAHITQSHRVKSMSVHSLYLSLPIVSSIQQNYSVVGCTYQLLAFGIEAATIKHPCTPTRSITA
jgi:hypothetical protein